MRKLLNMATSSVGQLRLYQRGLSEGIGTEFRTDAGYRRIKLYQRNVTQRNLIHIAGMSS